MSQLVRLYEFAERTISIRAASKSLYDWFTFRNIITSNRICPILCRLSIGILLVIDHKHSSYAVEPNSNSKLANDLSKISNLRLLLAILCRNGSDFSNVQELSNSASFVSFNLFKAFFRFSVTKTIPLVGFSAMPDFDQNLGSQFVD